MGTTMLEYGLRFLAGGIAVSAFAALGDTLRPKSFAGLSAVLEASSLWHNAGIAPRLRIPTIATTDSDGSRPPVPIAGNGCRPLPLGQRKAKPAKLLPRAPAGIVFNEPPKRKPVPSHSAGVSRLLADRVPSARSVPALCANMRSTGTKRPGARLLPQCNIGQAGKCGS
jgi:hypothetical protein